MRTIVDIGEHEKKRKGPSRKYHFVINDINKCVLARDLVIFTLLNELKDLDPRLDDWGVVRGSELGLEILATLCYVYIATMMPKFVFDHLRRVIDRVLRIIKAGQ